jgi:hypothetical protein
LPGGYSNPEFTRDNWRSGWLLGERKRNWLDRYLNPFSSYNAEQKRQYDAYAQAYTDANSGDLHEQPLETQMRRIQRNPTLMNPGRSLEFLEATNEYNKSDKLYQAHLKAMEAARAAERNREWALPPAASTAPAAPAAPATAPGAVNAAGYRQPFAAPKYTRQTLQ